MIPPGYSTGEWLATRLHLWAIRGYIPNVTLLEQAPGDIALEEGESAVARIVMDTGLEYILTDRRVLAGGAAVFRYAELVRCDWITDHPDAMVHARMKRSHWHRLLCRLADGRVIVMEQLGQAVFPLLRFFGSLIAEAKK